MSVTNLIDRIFPYASGWSRTGTRSILSLIEAGQDELLEYDGHQQVYIDPTDNKGFPPYLKTVSGTYTYNIVAANLSCGALTRTIGGAAVTVRAKKVLKVFVDTSKGDYGISRWSGRPYVYYDRNPYSVNTDRLQVAEVPVNSYAALEGTTARLEFLDDPGTENTYYFVEFTWEAPRLSAETVPLCVPLLYERALEDYVLGRIQRLSNGAANEYEQKFESYWKPRYRSEIMTGGPSRNNRETQMRFC